MGTTFVDVDGEHGFWMHDGMLELWLRFPHYLNEAISTESGRGIVMQAIRSLMLELKAAPPLLNKDTLNVIGFAHPYLDDIETAALLEVAEAFIDLIEGRIQSKGDDISFMPGSGRPTNRSSPTD